VERYLFGEEYREACERYRAHTIQKAAAVAREIKSSGRRLRVGHYVTVTQQYFPRLAEAFHEARELIDYQVFYSSSDEDGIATIRETGVEVFDAKESERASFRNFDVLFIQHPYYSIGEVSIDFYGIMRRLAEFILPADASLHPLICLIPYAYTVIDESVHHPVDGFHDLPVHNVGWRVYCETDWHLERGRAKSTLGGWNWRVTGYPKLDEIRDACSTAGRVGASGKTIIWAPHHNRWFQRIPILQMHDYFARLVDENHDIHLVVRPHPNLTQSADFDFSTLGMTKTGFEAIMSFWSSHPRAEVDLGADLPGLFARSDMMVTDCGGFQAEYFVSGRPLISCISQRMLSPFMKELLAEGNYFAGSVEEVDTTIRQLLAGENDPRRANRAKAIEIIQPIRNASRAIVEDLLSSFS
jgi:hypothetical protein